MSEYQSEDRNMALDSVRVTEAAALLLLLSDRREVAIKLIKPEEATSVEVSKRFLREAKLMSHLPSDTAGLIVPVRNAIAGALSPEELRPEDWPLEASAR